MKLTDLPVDRPVATIETNIVGTEVMLRAASKKRKPFFFSSSSEVYGKATTLPFREDGDLLIGPTTGSRWSYAAGKTLAEFLVLAHAKEKRLPVVIGRIFNTSGPRQTGRYGMVLPSFVAQALSGECLTVFGTGQQTRCFVHVRDVATAVHALMSTPEAYGQVFNIGSTDETSILELAEKVMKLSASESQIRFVPYEQAYSPGFEDLSRRVPSVERIGSAIGWTPERCLEDVIADVIEYQRHWAGQLGS